MRSKVFLFAILVFLSACEPEWATLQNLTGISQGAAFHISYWTETPIDHEALQLQIEDVLARLEKSMAYNSGETSKIELFNNNQSTDGQLVGSDIIDLVKLSQSVYQQSQGCFDLSIKPLFSLWGFDTDILTIPDQDAIQHALASVGMNKLVVLDDNHLKKTNANIKLDVSVLAKGYSISKISEVLNNFSVSNYRIDMAGQVKTNGIKPDGGAWQVAVDQPLPGERHLHKLVSMPKDASLSVMTASSYRYYFDAFGQRYNHVLDVRTGKPVTHNLLAVIVIHENPVLAEAWASALLCLGHQLGSPLANSSNLNAFFIRQQGSELLETQSVALRDANNFSIR